MPSRLQQLTFFPWTGGLVTALDETLIPQGSLTRADNIVYSTQASKSKREGINSDFDDLSISVTSRASAGTTRTLTVSGHVFSVGESIKVTSTATAYDTGGSAVTVTAVTPTTVSYVATQGGSVTESGVTTGTTRVTLNTPIVAGVDYYFGDTSTKTQRLAAFHGTGKLYLITSGGARGTAVVDNGTPYTVPSGGFLDASLTVYENRLILGTSGSTNTLKHYFPSDVGGFDQLRDMYNVQNYTTVDKESAGTTRTIGLSAPFAGDVGATIIIENMGADFDGTWTVASKLTVPDRITYTHTTSVTSGPTADIDGIIGLPIHKASISREHQGRLWTNDKSNPDRLHYSETGAFNVWGGSGDSGALDIGFGDGDPNGITAIFPTFKGVLFVAKRTKLYKITGTGTTGDEYFVEKISDSIGCVGHNAVASVDQDDILFVSDKGVHSIVATDQFGSFSGKFISADIQPTFNSWTRSATPKIHAAYVPNINSVAFAVAEEGSDKESIYFYNTQLNFWYRWPDVPCAALFLGRDADQDRLYLGDGYGRLCKAFNGTLYDINTSGTEVAVTMDVQTGLMFIDGNPSSIKAFKKFTLIYRPTGSHSISVGCRIDNFKEQPLVYNQVNAVEQLGVDFVLGSSILGFQSVAGPYTQSIDGYGRGIKIRLRQSGLNEAGEVLGFQVWFESSGDQQELRQDDEG